MHNIDWAGIALRSEIEYSKALGSVPTEYTSFCHLYSEAVPWAVISTAQSVSSSPILQGRQDRTGHGGRPPYMVLVRPRDGFFS